jgi:hypothetical protein
MRGLEEDFSGDSAASLPTLRPAPAGLRKTAVGLAPFARVFSGAFGAGANVARRPITRRKQPGR